MPSFTKGGHFNISLSADLRLVNDRILKVLLQILRTLSLLGVIMRKCAFVDIFSSMQLAMFLRVAVLYIEERPYLDWGFNKT